MSECRFLTKSSEAYAYTIGAAPTPITVHLCEWADQNPERLVDAPRWISRPAIGGLAIHPEQECVGCPAYRPKP